MTIQTIAGKIGHKKPVLIRERGVPRYVILDWETYQKWEEMREDLEDHIRIDIAQRESRGKKRYSLATIKKKYNL
jgi:PHD/YefM family antitoxin component YafN of YafNO toxin-antitoxin module